MAPTSSDSYDWYGIYWDDNTDGDVEDVDEDFHMDEDEQLDDEDLEDDD